jgi:hypothetical protein
VLVVAEVKRILLRLHLGNLRIELLVFCKSSSNLLAEAAALPVFDRSPAEAQGQSCV